MQQNYNQFCVEENYNKEGVSAPLQQAGWIGLLNPNIFALFSFFENNNKELFIVGGAPRSYFVQETPHDFDFCTNATPQQMREILNDMQRHGYKVELIPTGERFGTLTFKFSSSDKNEFYEITTYRKEGRYSDCRHPEEISFCSSLGEDLSRRDFTCNAIAWSPKTQFIDLYDGITDLQNETIRTVGCPEERFTEDVLRVMRLVRLSLRYNFSIEKNTLRAARNQVPNLKKISKERIGAELTKIFYLDLYNFPFKRTLNLLQEILICISDNQDINFKQIITTRSLLIKWFYLFEKDSFDEKLFSAKLSSYAIGSCLTTGIKRLNRALRVFNEYKDTQFVVKSLGCITPLEFNAFLELISGEEDEALIRSWWKKGNPTSLKDLNINGSIICNKFSLSEGKNIGKILDKCLDYVIQYPCKNNENCLITFVAKQMEKEDVRFKAN